MNECPQYQILQSRHDPKDRGVIVVPDWSDPALFLHLYDFVRGNPAYTDLGRFDYLVPDVNKGLTSKNLRNAGPTIDELAEAYGSSAIRQAQLFAEERSASLALLFGKRGYSQLDITASFYRRTG